MSLFGEMRHSTPEEQAACSRMIERMSTRLVPESELNQRVDRLKAENTELRKLLRQVVEHVHKEHLPHEDISFWSDRDNGVFRRMRELGVEVD